MKMQGFVKWLTAREGKKNQVTAGNAREIWRILRTEIFKRGKAITVDGVTYIHHPMVSSMFKQSENELRRKAAKRVKRGKKA